MQRYNIPTAYPNISALNKLKTCYSWQKPRPTGGKSHQDGALQGLQCGQTPLMI